MKIYPHPADTMLNKGNHNKNRQILHEMHYILSPPPLNIVSPAEWDNCQPKKPDHAIGFQNNVPHQHPQFQYTHSLHIQPWQDAITVRLTSTYFRLCQMRDSIIHSRIFSMKWDFLVDNKIFYFLSPNQRLRTGLFVILLLQYVHYPVLLNRPATIVP